MFSPYFLGVWAAIAAGVTFNLGMVVQKVAVNRTRKEAGLMQQLIRSPLWIAGFSLQFLVGIPLNMLAQANIGSAIIPGLMAIGLVVLAIGSIYLAKESLDWTDMAGILLVIGAVALVGLSGMGVDMKIVDYSDPAFLARLATFSLALAGISLACHFGQRQTARWRSVLRTTNAGFFFVQSNLWLCVLTAFLAKWTAGPLLSWNILPVGLISLVVFAASMLGVTETQRAFQSGDAVRLVPLQQIPQQLLPLLTFFVFELALPSAIALPLAGGGAVLALAGSALLARRQAALS